MQYVVILFRILKRVSRYKSEMMQMTAGKHVLFCQSYDCSSSGTLWGTEVTRVDCSSPVSSSVPPVSPLHF